MIDAEIWLITGTGGSRIDFTAGWLSSLPGFVDNQFRIKFDTGVSVSDANITKSLDGSGRRLSSILNDFNINAVQTADLHYVGVSHGQYQEDQIDVPARVVYIDVTSADFAKIRWEFVVKTFLSRQQTLQNLSNTVRANENFDEQIKFELDRIKFLNENNYRDGLPRPQHRVDIVLDYTKLCVPGGSYYLLEQLGITASDRYHMAYDQLLPISASPEEVTVFGQVYRFGQY